ncbi:MAG: VWA domain-containing protein [Gammaproteobacteria bacterium]
MAEDKKQLSKSSRAEIDSFLSKVAAAPAVKRAGERGRLIFAMDATASREPAWDRACHIQGQMFEETSALGGLDVRLCYYRGYGEFRATRWLSRAEDLLKSMTAVRCLGGYTQIEKVLRHALKTSKEEEVHALVLVGDCVEEDADTLCHLAGDLALRGVPMFIFHEGAEPRAASTFKQMARLSRGAYCPFDINSAQQLKDLLSAVAVYAAGGRRALADFSKNKGKDIQRMTHQIGKG